MYGCVKRNAAWSLTAINIVPHSAVIAKREVSIFSQTTDYALRSVAHLANCEGYESTIPEIAEAIQVNSPYLRKVINKLRDAEIVEAQRGKGGGIRLCRDPEKLTMLDVLNATDPIQRIERCPLGLPNHLKLCPLHAELDDAIKQIENVLGSRTIGELLATRRNATRCGFPKSKADQVYSL